MAKTVDRHGRLKSRKSIQLLFQRGQKIHLPSMGARWILQPAEPGQAMVLSGVAVSTRNFRKAVDRNRVKRLLRECWRLNRQQLDGLPGEGRQVLVMLVYTATELPAFSTLDLEMKELFRKLVTALKNRN